MKSIEDLPCKHEDPSSIPRTQANARHIGMAPEEGHLRLSSDLHVHTCVHTRMSALSLTHSHVYTHTHTQRLWCIPCICFNSPELHSLTWAAFLTARWPPHPNPHWSFLCCHGGDSPVQIFLWGVPPWWIDFIFVSLLLLLATGIA